MLKNKLLRVCAPHHKFQFQKALAMRVNNLRSPCMLHPSIPAPAFGRLCLAGPLPAEMGNMSSLIIFQFKNTNLTGENDAVLISFRSPPLAENV